MRGFLTVSMAALLAGAALPALALTPKTPPPPAQVANDKPALQLVAHDIRADRAQAIDAALTIAKLDVAVDITGRMAQTTLTVTFANPTDARLEGDFSLDLPVGASVTAYGLDVNGVMTDGVLEPKLKAQEVYEEQLRRGVDPGLAEVTPANQFRTHVFPILPGSGRTVRIVYVTPLGPDGRFEVPLRTAGVVGAASITVTAHGMTPVIATPADTLGFVIKDGGLAAETGGKALNGSLVITGLNPAQPVALSQHSNGERFFELTVAAEPAGSFKADSVRLYWDASRSRRDDDIAGETQLVADYIAKTTPERLDLVVFADGAPRVMHFDRPTPQAVTDALSKVTYSGATRFSDLDAAVGGHADVCLMVTDGQMTLDSFAVKHWPCRVMTVSSAKGARRDVLRQLAARNGGVYADLSALGHDEALKQLLVRAPKLWDILGDDGQSLPYSITPMGDDLYRVIGPAPRTSSLTLEYNNENQVFDLTRVATIANDGAGTLWGASQIDALNATDAPDADAILALARRYHVATPDVSFVVLESGLAYARAGVTPPSTLSADMLADYATEKKRLDGIAADRKAGRLESVQAMWDEEKAWWAQKPMSLAEAKREMTSARRGGRTDLDAPPPVVQPRETPPTDIAPPPPIPVPPVPHTEHDAPPVEMEAAPPPPPPPAGITSADVGSFPDQNVGDAMNRVPGIHDNGFGGDDSQEVVVTGVRRGSGGHPDSDDDSEASPPPSEIDVSTAQWNPDRPYIKALGAVKPGDKAAFDAVFAAQEKDYGDTPGFYFDVAEWMYRNGFAGDAAAVARNALDLDASDIDSQIILAGRLLRYGDADDALWLDEHIARLTPEKPQGPRNLALALIQVTDDRLAAKAITKDAAVATYERALTLLSQVVLTPWDGDYDGIEVVALMEANHLIAKLKAMGVDEEQLGDILPKSLTALLDVDVRITLEWNTDKTDMDLWVDEPSGERAIYSNPNTLLGGRLSNDMTRGYGPEEYLLHVAPKGTYKVLANVFAADVLNRNGATSVTVRLYRDWGRPTEKVESFVIELKKDQNGAVPVGQFVRN